MIRKLIVRAYRHAWWIPALSVVAIVSLVGTMVLFVLFAADQRSERDRSVRTDRALCALANDLRRDVVGIGDAGEGMVHGVVDVVLPADATNGERAEAIRHIRVQLEPVFDQHRAAVNAVQLIDCAGLGAQEGNP